MGSSHLGLDRRFEVYSASHGVTPAEAMLMRDFAPGIRGGAANYVHWLDARWTEWRAKTGWTGAIGPQQEDRFDRWLERRYAGVIKTS